MPARVRVRSLAKINLDLRVLHRRPDGFHELRTIFQTISLADTLEIEYRPGRTEINLESNLNIPDNIVERAAHSVLRSTRRTGRVGFVLQKRIPLGGGLGGGSSNAAAVLLALPPLMGTPLPLAKLVELAAELGSDVPFFLFGGTTVGLGRGTELYPLPDFPNHPLLVVAPGIHVSTANAYRDLGRKPGELDSSAVNDFLSVAWRSLGPSGGAETNDFESVVFGQHPQLKSIKGKLLSLGARTALMTGSGSSVFGLFESRESRDRAADAFREKSSGCRVYPVTMVSRSRYRALWRRQLAEFGDRMIWPPLDRYAK